MSDNDNSQKIKPTKIIKWIDNINEQSTTGAYFTPKEGDFNKFLQILIDNSYPQDRLKKDIKSGQTYVKFLNSYPDKNTNTKKSF